MNLNESSTAGMSSSESKTLEPESKAPENLTSVEPSDPSSESKTLESESKASENLTATEPSNPSSEDEKLGEQTQEEGKEEEEEEEEGECGFCLFMKGGGCKESFIAWEKCIEDGETNKEDIVEKCFEVTAALKKCMESHSDYYEPVLRAEKAAEEELEREVASRDSEKSKEDGNSEEAVSEEN